MAGLIPLGGLTAASDATTAGSINQAGSQSRTAVDARVNTIVPPMIADLVANEPEVVQAVADAILADTSIIKYKRLTTSDPLVFNDLETGVYQITTAAVVTALGLPGGGKHGVLTVQRWNTSFGLTGVAFFETSEQPSRSWSYAWSTAATPTNGWQELTPDMSTVRRTLRAVTSPENPLVLGDLTNNDYLVSRTVDINALGLPSIYAGVLSINRWPITAGTNPGVLTYTTVTGEIWQNAYDNTDTLGTWSRLDRNAGGSGGTVGADMSIRHDLLRTRHLLELGGPIDVGTATPVCFIWDDWDDLMISEGIFDLAETYEVPINYAMCSRTVNPANWATIDATILDGWVEPSNHGATHASTITPEQLYDEIVTGLDELQANLPSAGQIKTWVMPTNSWDGFNSGESEDAWASTAGQLILGHHAYATGKLPAITNYRAYPMIGTPYDGADRIWVEAADLTTASRQNLITRHYGTNRGVIISAHANLIGATGRWTLSEVEAFFSWLHDEEVAGRIKLMHLSEWAWAKSAN